MSARRLRHLGHLFNLALNKQSWGKLKDEWVQKAGKCHLVLVKEVQAFDNVKSNRGALVVPMQLSRCLRQCLPQVSTLHLSIQDCFQPISAGFSHSSWGYSVCYRCKKLETSMPKTQIAQSTDR